MVIGQTMYWTSHPLILFFRAILENIVEFQPEMSKDIAEAGFMAWLIKKLKVAIFLPWHLQRSNSFALSL